MSTYTKTTFVEGAAPGISAAELNKIGDGVSTAHSELAAHQAVATLDHPDASVTDAKIGNRTINQALSGVANTGLLTSLLSWLAGAIKAVKGTTNWYDNPATTLAGAASHAARTDNPHAVTAAQIGAGAILAQITAVDGSGSGLDADMLDGLHSASFVANGGATPSITAGTLASRPAAGTAGRLFYSTDENRVYRDDGAVWQQVSGRSASGSFAYSANYNTGPTIGWQPRLVVLWFTGAPSMWIALDSTPANWEFVLWPGSSSSASISNFQADISNWITINGTGFTFHYGVSGTCYWVAIG